VYTLSANYTSTKAGTAKNPVPTGVRLGFDITDTENLRPLGLDRLTIRQPGAVYNGRFFKACAAETITNAQSDQNCPFGSLVATGFARNIAGNSADRSDKSQQCYLSLRLHNSGRNKMALFVAGSPTAPAGQTCPLRLAVAIPISITTSGGASTLNLNIPQSLKYPLGTIRNSLVQMRLTMPRKTVRRSGERRGFLESRGGCRGGRRSTAFTFYNEGNNVVPQSASARCTK
jgi:hypothetical protein